MSKPPSRHLMPGARGKYLSQELLSHTGSWARAALAIPAAKITFLVTTYQMTGAEQMIPFTNFVKYA